jgi:hypothetical protein
MQIACTKVITKIMIIQLAQALYMFLCSTIYVGQMKEYGELVPISLAARSKAWVCARSLAGIAGSNSAVAMDECLL